MHIPFCAARCDYCDFATWTDKGHLVDAYVDACVADVERHRGAGHPAATSVFFGGGTPSLIGADRLVRILDAIDGAPSAEVTVECNPDSVDAAKLATYHRAGEPVELRRAVDGAARARRARPHARSRERHPAVALARRRVRAPQRDLIYGTPGESADDWRDVARGVIVLGVTT